MSSGLFLTLDGLDGAGKTTQAALLADWLRARGRTVIECRDPGSTELGQHLRQLLLNYRGPMDPACEALLFMASRAQLVAEVIRPALDAGHVVVSDRFLLANVVYQGHAGGLDPELLWQAGRLSTGGLEPHLTLVLDLPLEESLRRRKGVADRLEGRDLDFHARVRAGFQHEAQRRPDRVRLIDAARPSEQVQEALRCAVEPMLNDTKR